MQPWENSDDKWFYLKVHLELADLGVEGEGVKEHGADESYVGRLAGEREWDGVYIRRCLRRWTENKTPVIDPLPPVNPESGQLGKDVDDAEGLQVVDEDVGHPQAVDQLKVHCECEISFSEGKLLYLSFDTVLQKWWYPILVTTDKATVGKNIWQCSVRMSESFDRAELIGYDGAKSQNGHHLKLTQI